MRILQRQQVAELLTLDDCIAAVEDVFAQYARGDLPAAPGVLGTHVEGGGFHVKTAVIGPAPGHYAVKINANFPGNPARHGLPTIQGMIALFDAVAGRLLALLDSIEITILRTAAATAVAARHLARADASIVTLCGCGAQGGAHLRALSRVRRLTRAYVVDLDPDRARRFAGQMSEELSLPVSVAPDLAAAVRASDICVTCTPARRPLLSRDALHPGLFIAAVGADSPEKQELDPRILHEARVVVDLLDQAANIGELHHAIEAGLMSPADVHAELGQIVTGARAGRTSDHEIFVFDSTGTALQDAAAAALVWERARGAGYGFEVALAD
jgi:ornithine cyclodeaminase/alanine dehydrogenase-like protein (mu-crystallin family)